MKLKDLLQGLSPIHVQGKSSIDMKGIQCDSRKIKDGDLFIAIKGYDSDGHTYIDSAIANGAQAIILEEWPKDIKDNITYIQVENTRKAMAICSANFYDHPSNKLDVIGITGTNGKTTTTYLLQSIYKAHGKHAGIIGTMGTVIGQTKKTTNTTTPESLDLQREFHTMKDHKMDKVVMEVSSHALELYRVYHTRFLIGVFTNLSVDHLDFHEDMEHYYQAKKRLFQQTTLKNCINIDDAYGKRLAKELDSEKTWTYGLSPNADIRGKDVELHEDGIRFILESPFGQIQITSSIPGEFTVYNCLAAAAVALADGISLEEIQKGLFELHHVKGRLEKVETNQDFSVFIDFAHTPDALEKVLKVIRGFAPKRVVVVFGAGGDRDPSKRKIMGQIAGKYADFCIVTSDNPRREDPASIINEILPGIKEVGGKYVAIVDRKEAIFYALKHALPKDTILLAGKGHETYVVIGREKIHFDEREVIAEGLTTYYSPKKIEEEAKTKS